MPTIYTACSVDTGLPCTDRPQNEGRTERDVVSDRRMIEPPQLYSQDRKMYDIMDLEQLGKIALQLGLHLRKDVKAAFLDLLQMAGTRLFPSKYYDLSCYVMAAYRDQDNSAPNFAQTVMTQLLEASVIESM